MIIAPLLLMTISFRTSLADLFIEPEIGMRAFTGDVADLLDPGISIGGAVGFIPTPRLRIFARGDLSFHPGSDDTSYSVDRGIAIGMAVGGRFVPMGRDASRAIQPHLGAEAGLTLLGWSLKNGYAYFTPDGTIEDKDALAAFTLGAEVGVMIRTNSRVALGLAARLRRHFWTNETANGFKTKVLDPSTGRTHAFKGSEFGMNARLTLTFDI